MSHAYLPVEAAQLLKLSERFVRRICEANVLKATKIKGRWQIDLESLEEYIQTRIVNLENEIARLKKLKEENLTTH